MDADFEIYPGKKLSGLFKDIVTNSNDKRNQLDVLVSDMRSMVKSPADIVTIIPMLKDYIDAGIKNDELLVKLAAVVQRMAVGAADGEGGNGSILTDEERKQLMAEINAVATNASEPIPTVVGK